MPHGADSARPGLPVDGARLSADVGIGAAEMESSAHRRNLRSDTRTGTIRRFRDTRHDGSLDGKLTLFRLSLKLG